jgi:K(+)-stimulated pyrophosphate-energized sodium pump
LVPAACVIAIAFAGFLIWDVLRRDKGTPQMKDIADRIFEGAMAFMRRQYTTISLLAIAAAVLIAILLGFLAQTDINGDGVVTGADKLGLGWRTAIAFLVGAFCSAVSGFVGMYIAVQANVRTAAAAAKGGLREAITVALRGGAVSGFLIVILSLVGVTSMFYAYGGGSDAELVPFLIVGFGFGASFVALFAQLGGGIYTKAADMGADLVGKVEAGIPEDDPRNAAVIADLVGDNVGDCAGRGADLFESTAAENIGAMILGVAAYVAALKSGLPHPEVWVLFPLVVRSLGLISSILGLLGVRGKEGENPMSALNRGYFIAVGFSIVGLFLASFMLKDVASMSGRMWLFGSGVIGIATSVAFVYITQYYTEYRYKPVQDIASASRTGPATNAVAGISIGFETTFATAVTIGVAIWLSHWMGSHATMPDGTVVPNGGLFGTAVATMGMLMTAAYILAMDTFGPITDNAAGIVEMAGGGKEVREVTDRMDAVGNTTKALTKGYAMGSAGLAAFLLFSAFLDDVAKIAGTRFAFGGVAEHVVNLAKPEVFIGGLLGVMLVFLFSALALRAVSKTASAVIAEVRRQFKEDPGIMQGTSRPDYARCVDITARAGLREMVLPGVLAVGMPIVVGVIFRVVADNGAEAVGSFLMVGTIGGLLMATFMNNAGGAWDNAKKFIESGLFKSPDGKVEGKRTQTHAAAVVGDTIGDPFKDTAGPSLHVLVKLLATVTLVLVPIFV